ncbi:MULTISPECIES: hypothetical protein [unclassified Streptomyces]|uniref:hypothetical protein n=1 Tax=Streptomyces sp. NPDC058812 TaxID=3346639 RepID=UPI0036927A23
MSARGSTRPGVRAALPDGDYEVRSAVYRSPGGSVCVDFEGEDGRSRTFDFADCELPGWHEDLAVAVAARIGPGGGLRTTSSTLAMWNPLQRFLRTLAGVDEVPRRPEQMRVEHAEYFADSVAATMQEVYAWRFVEHVAEVLRLMPPTGRVPNEVLDVLRVRIPGQPRHVTGYSEGELRRLLAAARADVAAMRKRITHGRALLAAPDGGPDAGRLRTVAEGGRLERLRETRAAGRMIFPMRDDLPGMLVLMTAVSGRNVETIKELPAEHQVIEGKAVEVVLTKRRRGARRWHESVLWEIGPPGQELRHPGGLYLLLHDLMAPSRTRAADPQWFWSFFRGLRYGDQHGSPFRSAMTADIPKTAWVARHGLTDDGGAPMAVTFTRIRTSVEARRTRQMGGHLPSAARSNTVPVLFRNYLRDDPSTVEWAHEVMADALVDAEQAALEAHRRLADRTGRPEVLPDGVPAPAGTAQGPWSGCRDAENHPVTGRACRASFLECFHCGNCVITSDHLPRLLALLDAMDNRRRQMDEQVWWQRYGPAFAAIRHDILTRFTPEQVREANPEPVHDADLDLVEEPWQQP